MCESGLEQLETDFGIKYNVVCLKHATRFVVIVSSLDNTLCSIFVNHNLPKVNPLLGAMSRLSKFEIMLAQIPSPFDWPLIKGRRCGDEKKKMGKNDARGIFPSTLT